MRIKTWLALPVGPENEPYCNEFEIPDDAIVASIENPGGEWPSISYWTIEWDD